MRTVVGGAATSANERMGSLAYTAGNRIAFRHEPDVRLAAHEATHVIQQRAGVQLKDGVGRPGDDYEQQADAVADAVERGELAKPLLERSTSVAVDPRPALQHLLAVNAMRLFEPPVSTNPAAGILGAGKGEIVPAGKGPHGPTPERSGGTAGESDAEGDAPASGRAPSAGPGAAVAPLGQPNAAPGPTGQVPATCSGQFGDPFRSGRPNARRRGPGERR